MRRVEHMVAIVALSLAALILSAPDVVLFPPESQWLASGLHHGALRWWCTERGLGYPLIASGLGAGLYPLRALTGAPANPHFFLAGLGAYVALRRLRAPWWLGLGAALVCIYADFSLMYRPLLQQAAAWAPGLLAAAAGGRWPAFALAAALAILAAGMPVPPAFGVGVLV